MIARIWRGETRADDAIHAFAGEDISVAVFFPDDDRYLTYRELTVSHYEVVERRGLV
jgi:hypothetical protein